MSGHPSRRQILHGQVLTHSCSPVERALVDLWHANERGEYDNAGFRYRGHLFTDGEGRYRFRTILPALYPGRTRHYHIKVQAPERPVFTTQLYFPDEPANRRDGLFRRDLAMRITEARTASQRVSILCSTCGNEGSASSRVARRRLIDRIGGNRRGRTD